MIEPVSLALKLAFYLLPAYFANCSALLMGGKTPLDMNIKFMDNSPLLGPGKTVKGAFFGIFAGIVVAAILGAIFKSEVLGFFGPEYVTLGTLLAIGAVVGDMAASFVKRRFNIPRGREVLLLDQLDFVVGAMLLGSLLYVPSITEIAIALVFTFLAHKVSNFVAYKAGLKGVPW